MKNRLEKIWGKTAHEFNFPGLQNSKVLTTGKFLKMSKVFGAAKLSIYKALELRKLAAISCVIHKFIALVCNYTSVKIKAIKKSHNS